MKIKQIIFTITFILFVVIDAIGQNTRLNTNNNIGWYNYFTTVKLTEKVGIHAEYQWRRNKVVTEWQQSLFRTGINYQLKPNVLARIGYAWVETWPYGAYSINSLGKDFTEHRIFEMLQLTNKEGCIDVSHRFMLEQRFVGKYSSNNVSSEDEYPLTNRFRYMLRLQAPLNGSSIKDNTPYFAIYDELFIGFGKNVNANIFDQNRIGVLLGYKFNNNLKIEGGYINQTLQFGRQINSQNVFQYNNGIILNLFYNFDLTKTPKE